MLSDEEVRRMVTVEVARQLSPLRKAQDLIKSRVESIDRWKLSLWSDGTGGPPGFLETARAEDDKRYERLFGTMDSVKEKQTAIDIFIGILKERDERREKNKKLAISLLKWVGTPVGALLATLMALVGHQAVKVGKILWEDYLQAHPKVVLQMQSTSQTDPAAPVKVPQKQDATIPSQP